MRYTEVMLDTTNENPEIAACFKELCQLVYEAETSKEVAEIFSCLFTPAELKDISERWLLVKELDAGVTQREIARKYNMSLCKITRGSKELKKDNSSFRKMLDKLSSK